MMAKASPKKPKSSGLTSVFLVLTLFFVGVGTGIFLAVHQHIASDPLALRNGGNTEFLDAPVIRKSQQEDIEKNLRSPLATTAPVPAPVKPTVVPPQNAPSTPCLWTELHDLAQDKTDFARRVVVASSHGTTEGTSFLVLGNTTKITCGRQQPMRDIILSDPPGTNKFNLHRIDCPPKIPLVAGSQSCPAVPHGQHPGKQVPQEAKNVICLAPLYDAHKYGRWLMEWVTYHLSLGFDHIMIPDFNLEGDMLEYLQKLEDLGQVRLVPWNNAESNKWILGSRMYEHGKLPAWNRCYLEYQETAEWMLFIDIDEVLGVKTDMTSMLDWMTRKYEETKQAAFSIKNRVVLSVLDHEIDHDKLLFEQWNAMEEKPKCPYNCGDFHLGRWKYFIKGHGGKEKGIAAAPIPEVLWTHAIQGLDYQRARQLMALIPYDTVAELRHYQAHWYIHGVKQGNYGPSHFQTIYASLPVEAIRAMKTVLRKSEHSAAYQKAARGLAWALQNNGDQPLADELVATIRQGAKVFEAPVCSTEQINIHKQIFDYTKLNTGYRINTPLKFASACPDDSEFVDEYFGRMETSSFLAVNVGCNKGLDAIAMAGLLSQDEKFQTSRWQKSLNGVRIGAMCGEPKIRFFEESPKRQGKVFCVEPVPNTFKTITDGLAKNPDYSDTLILTQAAMSNSTGKVLFPDANAGEEAMSIGDCYKEDKKATLKCEEVPLYKVDDFLSQEQNIDLTSSGPMIDLMLIDSEGFDWEVIQGAKQSINRAKYVIFEVHVNGNWMKHSLVDTVETIFRDFNCYWLGPGKLWRMTGCMDDEKLREIYEYKSWSNVGCARKTEVELAHHMERIFLQTQYFYSTSDLSPISEPLK